MWMVRMLLQICPATFFTEWLCGLIPWILVPCPIAVQKVTFHDIRQATFPYKKQAFNEIKHCERHIPLGIQSPSENGFIEPKYYAFRR